MKKFVAFVVAVAAVPALVGPSIAQTEKKPTTPPAATEADRKPATPAPAKMDAVKTLAGEIVSMDQGARTVTVKHMDDKKPVQMTLSVEDPSIFTQFKPGDHVKVTYAEMGDKRVARSIVKG
jgi:Cu/Ag efflux protein CusF